MTARKNRSSSPSPFHFLPDHPRWPHWLAAVLIAWAMTATVLLFSSSLARLIKKRGLIAIERLMGMVLTAIAIKMILTGIGHFFGIRA